LKFSGRCAVGYSFMSGLRELKELFACERIWTIFGVRVRF